MSFISMTGVPIFTDCQSDGNWPSDTMCMHCPYQFTLQAYIFLKYGQNCDSKKLNVYW